ncbi:hypothetical protein MPH_09802 [Macrophomina phaseolina MS6]|uniref:Uncharacterized protein n=1 Tax=Macrophomina phaseolina (strain MS6) TaxID=1126212 RepID=K2RJW4_MACPH|nr:hypothetical protein MPH_09802 [Macrophomina phaseolina MS6]
MAITPNSSFTARCLLNRLQMAIAAIQSHARFDQNDPRNSHYTLRCLWDFLHRTRYMLSQIDLQKLDGQDEDTLDAFEDVISRTCMAHAMLTDPSGLMISRVIGASVPERSLSSFLRLTFYIGQFTEDSAEQRKTAKVDLSQLLTAVESEEESEGEWEEGADDSEWEDVGPDTPPHDRCLFLELPREIRDQVYKYLLDADYTKRHPTGIIHHKPARYEWHLQVALLRANKQIYKEAREVLGRENRFVVLERDTDRLKQSVDQRQDGGDRNLPDPPIWFGRAKSLVSVPGEVMRINFSPRDGRDKNRPTDYFVFLTEELRDFFINLGKYRTGGVFRTKDLVCTVTLNQPKVSEVTAITKRREAALLDPLTGLRQLSKVIINGASEAKAQRVAHQMKRQEFSSVDVLSIIDEILATANAHAQVGNHGIAVSYTDWCMSILSFFDASNAHLMDENMAGDIPESIFLTDDQQISMCAAMFHISLKRAFSCIHSGAFEDAFESSDSALRLAIMVTDMPEYSNFPGAQNGVAKRGAMIEWMTKQTSARIANSGAKNLIRVEDVARAYWYRAQALSSLEGRGQEEETDRMFALSLSCFVGHEEVANELCTLDLDLTERLGGCRRGQQHLEHDSKLRDISYNKHWQRPEAPVIKSRNEVTDGGMAYMLSRCNIQV